MSERICFAIRYGREDRWFSRYEAGTCAVVYTHDKTARHLWDQGSRARAYFECARLADGANMAPRVVKITIRRKPKAPPPLKVGDEVVVRGTFECAGDRCLVVKIGGHSFGIPGGCVERVKP